LDNKVSDITDAQCNHEDLVRTSQRTLWAVIRNIRQRICIEKLP